MFNSQPQRQILSVSQLNQRARQLLETHLPLLWIEGEISNFSRPSSGHWYFTLKDSQAQVRCAMFRNRNTLVRQPPQQGQQVLVRARVSLYEGRGDYQLIVEHMEEAGFGALQRAFEELKQRLANEGLFNPAIKQSLPTLPNHIGVVTSPSGAAIRDILTVLRRRFPVTPVSIFPVAVQGAEAAPQICNAIARANQLSDCDLLIVGRGGGSLEDLWPFNEEMVARAIFASRIPVISAVGHEVDVTISDFVADVRAPTPSAAAELAVPDRADMLQALRQYSIRLGQLITQRLNLQQHRLDGLRARMRHPGERLRAQAQRLDHLEIRLQQNMSRRLHTATIKLNSLVDRQKHLHPTKLISTEQQRLDGLNTRLQQQIRMAIHREKQRLGKAAELLETVSPLNTLQRGYAIVQNESGEVLRSSQATTPGDKIVARLGQGKLFCTVDKVENN